MSLSSQQREFLEVVSQASLASPFSDTRDRLDDLLLQDCSQMTDENILAGVLKGVEQRVLAIGDGKLPEPKQYTGRDRELVTTAILFIIFHKYMHHFDDYIERQLREDHILPFPKGKEFIRELKSHSFTMEEADKYLAIFFQLRRAYYFVKKFLIGESQCMRILKNQIWNNIFTNVPDHYKNYLWSHMEDFSTLVFGETGTGKGSVAKTIGFSAFIEYDGKKEAFNEHFGSMLVSINISQFPESIVESQLFGHVKGAFTGAIQDIPGVLGRCRPLGSILIDELGELQTDLQVKLLRVLQERLYTPVGSMQDKRFFGRVIGATHQDIETMRKSGRFRDDFYYRLCSDTISVPPLRQRIDEDPTELERLTRQLVTNLTGSESIELESYVLESLDRPEIATYRWPGNVRELEQAIRRILMKGSYQTAIERTTYLVAARDGKLTQDELLSGYAKQLYQVHRHYTEVAEIMQVDRRTAKKYIEM